MDRWVEGLCVATIVNVMERISLSERVGILVRTLVVVLVLVSLPRVREDDRDLDQVELKGPVDE